MGFNSGFKGLMSGEHIHVFSSGPWESQIF